MTSTSLENCVCFAQYGVWHCHVQAQNFFGKLPYPREGDFGARWQCGVAGRPCHPPPPAPICLLQGKHPTPWRRGRHFQPFFGCNSPSVFHQHADELGHNHHSGKGWTCTHQQISQETSADGSTSGAWAPICDVGDGDHESVWGMWLDVLSDTPQLPNVFGPCGQRHDVKVAWSALPWFSTIIRIRAWSSIGVTILNRCPCGLWIALLVYQTWQRALDMPPCETHVFLYIALWDTPRTDNRTMSSRITGGILAGMIATLFWNCNLHTETAHSWMYSIQIRHTVFWSN